MYLFWTAATVAVIGLIIWYATGKKKGGAGTPPSTPSAGGPTV